MKILMITQKIDAGDDILGVYHEWAREIAKSFDKLFVICLYEGKNDLPENIKVLSLGKEDNNFQFSIFKKLKYMLLFQKYIWQERKNYDAVLVHMNPIYVILGWPLWAASGKGVFLFYAHYKTGYILKLASIFCTNILTSVRESCGLKSPKVRVVGQGIDTDTFRRDGVGDKKSGSFLFVGRISPVKKVDILIDAFSLAARNGGDVTLNIVGGVDYGKREYFELINEKIKNYNLGKRVRFAGSVPNKEMARVYNDHEFLINITETGSFDKAILEAMACECLPVVSNRAYENIFPEDFRDLLIFPQDDAGALAKKIKALMSVSAKEKTEIGEKLREIVIKNHSLSTLGGRLNAVFSKT